MKKIKTLLMGISFFIGLVSVPAPPSAIVATGTLAIVASVTTAATTVRTRRSQVRQDTRVEERTEDRMERRRGD